MRIRQISPSIRPHDALALRDLVERRYEHPVLSILLDLDPSRYATPPARATQVASLLDEASKKLRELEPEDRARLERALENLRAYTESDEFPPDGAKAAAIFSDGVDLFDVVPLQQSVEPRSTIRDNPAVEFLPELDAVPAWAVVLVSRRAARLFTGSPDLVAERTAIRDDVHRQHDQGGWSQARYQRSVEEEKSRHLKNVVAALVEMDRTAPPALIVLGGPAEVRADFERRLPDAIRDRITGSVDVDVERASVEEVRDRVAPIAERAEREAERRLLDQLAERLGRNDRAVSGLDPIRDALGEKRVEHIVCEAGYALSDDVVTAALEQRARVTMLRHHPIGISDPIAALLRF